MTILTEYKDNSSESYNVQKSSLIGKSALLKVIGTRMPTQNTLKSTKEYGYTIQTDFQFYTDKTNTIDYENIGIFFLGKQNNNPIKKEIETYDGNVYTTTYTYEYDSKERITKQISDSDSYDVYTYVD